MLKTRSQPTPDAIDLELGLLGGLSAEQQAEVDSAPLEADRAALEHARHALQDVPAPSLRPRYARWIGAAAAVLVAGLVGAALLVPPGDTLRPMGGGPLHGAVAPGDAPDTLRVQVTPGIDGWLSIATVQENGRVSVLVAGDAQPIAAGRTLDVDGRIRLDDWSGREWLVVLESAEALDGDAVRQRVRAMLPSPTTGTNAWVTEVTR